MIEATLVGDLLAEVVPWFETRIREGLSCGGGHLGVMHTRVSNGKSGLSIAIVNGMHCRICPWDACCVEPKQYLLIMQKCHYPVVAKGLLSSSNLSLV